MPTHEKRIEERKPREYHVMPRHEDNKQDSQADNEFEKNSKSQNEPTERQTDKLTTLFASSDRIHIGPETHARQGHSSLIAEHIHDDEALRMVINEHSHAQPWQVIHDVQSHISAQKPYLEGFARQDKELANQQIDDQFPSLPVANAQQLTLYPEEKRHADRHSEQMHEVNELLYATRQDQEITRILEHHKDIEPWQTIQPQNLEREETRDNDGKSKDVEKVEHEHVEIRSGLDERLSLSSYSTQPITSDSARDNKETQEPAQVFNCYVPADVGNKLTELGQLEPETMQYLHDKYGYLEQHVCVDTTDNQPSPQGHTFAEAAEHAEYTLGPSRDNVCSERCQRAQLQTEQLEHISQGRHLPTSEEYVAISYRSNDVQACYEMQDITAARWEKAELLPSLQKIIDQQHERTCPDELTHEQSTAARLEHELDDNQQKKTERKVIMPIERDLVKWREDELEREITNEPEPGYFCTVGIGSNLQVHVLSCWTARTWEEFNSHDPQATPTPQCLTYMAEVDRQWKDWQRRADHKRAEVDASRRVQDDYDHDDLER